MWIPNVVNRDALPVLEKVAAYTEARHRMLTENIANIDTPGYRTKHLDTATFQEALGKALTRRAEDPSGAFKLPATREFHEDASGGLVVTPVEEPAENILFHDGTNARLERQMAMLAENALMHQAATELLRTQFDTLRRAIRGAAT